MVSHSSHNISYTGPATPGGQGGWGDGGTGGGGHGWAGGPCPNPLFFSGKNKIDKKYANHGGRHSFQCFMAPPL